MLRRRETRKLPKKAARRRLGPRLRPRSLLLEALEPRLLLDGEPILPTLDDQYCVEGALWLCPISFSDSDSAAWTAVIDYGDQSPLHHVTISDEAVIPLDHSYGQSGSYTVAISLSDDGGHQATGSFDVAAINIAPMVNAPACATVLLGEQLSAAEWLSFADPEYVGTAFTASIDWGDGQTSQAAVAVTLGGPGTPTSGVLSSSHIYAAAGSYWVTASVTDANGDIGAAGFTVIVPSPPEANPGGPYTMIERTGLLLAGGASVAGTAPIVEYAWDLDGDGQYGEMREYYDPPPYQIAIPIYDEWGHVVDYRYETFDEPGYYVGEGMRGDERGECVGFDGSDLDGPGQYTVGLRVTDEYGCVDTATATITITDILPTARANGPYQVAERGSVTLSAAGTSDPYDTLVLYEWDLGDDGTWELSGTSPWTELSREQFLSQLSFGETVPLRLRVVDSAGSSATALTTVTATNYSPLVQAGSNAALEQPQRFERTVGFVDASYGPWAARVAYGEKDANDQLIWEPLSIESDGSMRLEHNYAADGTYLVRVHVVDERQAEGIGQFSVTVGNLPPVVTIVGPMQVAEVTTVSFTAEGCDPGGDALTYVWDLDGDGIYGEAGEFGTGTTISYTPPMIASSRFHTICVRASDGEGGISSASLVVQLQNTLLPIAEAGGPYRVYQGASVALTALASEGATRFEWDLDGDGVFGEQDEWVPGYEYTDPYGNTSWVDGYSIDHAGRGDEVGGIVWFDAANAPVGLTTVWLRAYDDEGHASDTAEIEVVVNYPPGVYAGDDAWINEGETFVREGFVGDAESTSWSGWVYYGDGQSEYVGVDPMYMNFWLQHVYQESGTYEVCVTILDDGGQQSEDHFFVNVANAPPHVEGSDRQLRVGEPLVSSQLAFCHDPDDGELAYRIEWGDGTIETGTTAGTSAIAGSHLYQQAGSYDLRVCVTDPDGGSGDTTFRVYVHALTANPGGPYAVNEGTSLILSASGTTAVGFIDRYLWDLDGDGVFGEEGRRWVDPVSVPEQVTEEWIDGVYYRTVIPGYVIPGSWWGSGLRGDEYGPSPEFWAAGLAGPTTCNVRLKVVNDAEYSSAASNGVAVTILNVAPTANAGADAKVAEGGSIVLDASASFDPGGILSYLWDFDGDEDYDDASGVTVIFSAVSYAGPATRTVALQVIDAAGAAGFDTVEVTIQNRPPVVTVGGPRQLEGTRQFVAPCQFIDVGNGPWSAEVDYGDNSGWQPLLIVDRTFELDHEYAADGDYQVQVRVSDDYAAPISGEYTFLLEIGQFPPTADAGGPYTVDELGAVQLVGTASDPGNDIDFSTGQWDLDGDGVYETDGMQPVFVADRRSRYGTAVVRFRVYDADGGCGMASATITVNNTAPPTAVVPSVVRCLPDSDVALSGLDSYDPGNNIVLYEWDLDGDGVFGEESSYWGVDEWGQSVWFSYGDHGDERGAVVGYHSAVTQGDYTVWLRVSDGVYSHSTSGVVRVAENGPPEITFPGTATAQAGGAWTLPGSLVDSDSTSWTAQADYGSGWENVTLDAATGGLLLGHTYAEPGEYTVFVEVADNQGAVGSATVRVTVVAAPVIVLDYPVVTVWEGQAATAAGGILDALPSEWTAEVDYGGGWDLLELSSEGRFSLDLSLVTVTSGEGYVAVRASDGVTTIVATQTVDVINSLPSIENIPTQYIAADQPLRLADLVHFTDPHTAGNETYFYGIDWDNLGRPSTGVATILSSSIDGVTGTIDMEYVFSVPNSYVVQVYLGDGETDAVGNLRYTTVNFEVVVSLPEDSYGVSLEVGPWHDTGEGQECWATASVVGISQNYHYASNYNPATGYWEHTGSWHYSTSYPEWSAEVDFGDGQGGGISKSQPIIRHRYDDSGWYQLTVSGSAEGGNYTFFSSLDIGIDNVAPTVSIESSGPRRVGSSLMLSALASDPGGVYDPLTYFWSVFAPDDSLVAEGTEATLAFTPSVVGAYRAMLVVSDDDGSTQSEATITITDVNLPPTDLSLSAATVAENQPAGTTVATLSTTDADPNDAFTYTLAAGVGSEDNAAFAIAGSSLVTARTFDYERKGSYAIRLRTSDAAGEWFEKALVVTVGDVNDPPTLAAIANQSVAEDCGSQVVVLGVTPLGADPQTVLVAAVSSDTTLIGTPSLSYDELQGLWSLRYTPAANATGIAVVTVTVTDAAGAFCRQSFSVTVAGVNDAPAGVDGRIRFDEDATYTVQAAAFGFADPGDGVPNTLGAIKILSLPAAGQLSLRGVAVVLDQTVAASDIAAGALTFTPAANASGDDYALLTFLVQDDGGTADGGIDWAAVPNTLWFDVTPVNDPPTAVSLSSFTIPVGADSGTTIGTLSATDVDGAGFAFSLPVDVEDNEVFTVVDGVLKTAAAVGAAGHTYHLIVRCTDAGGSAIDQRFALYVGGNEAPANLTLSASTVAENAIGGTVVGQLSVADPNNADRIGYALVTGEGAGDNALFAIENNALVLREPADYEAQGTFGVRVRAIDAGGLSCEAAFTIVVTDEDEAPWGLALSVPAIAEDQPAGSVVGSVTVFSEDIGPTFTYTLPEGPGGEDNGLFVLDSQTGQLTILAPSNYEAKSVYHLLVRAQGTNGLAVQQSLVLAVLDLNDAPTGVSLASDRVAGDRPVGTVVGQLVATDPDAGDAFSFSLVAGVGGTDNAAFSIDSEGRLLTAATFTEGEVRYLRVRGTDRAGLAVESPLTVVVTGPVIGLHLSNCSLDEQGTVVGQLSVTGAPPDSICSYSFTGGQTPDYAGLFEIVGDELHAKVPLDYEQYGPTLSLSIDASTNYGSITGEFTITLVDVNEAPAGLYLSRSEVAENQPAGAFVGQAVAADPDRNDSIAYVLVSGAGDDDNAWFSVDGLGRLLTNAVFHQAQRSSYSVRLRATDSAGHSIERPFTVTVLDASAPAVIGLGSPLSTMEGLVFSRAGSFADADSTSWSASVDYGDGSGRQPLALNPDRTFTLTHVFGGMGEYRVQVFVQDDSGSVGRQSLSVTVHDASMGLRPDVPRFESPLSSDSPIHRFLDEPMVLCTGNVLDPRLALTTLQFVSAESSVPHDRTVYWTDVHGVRYTAVESGLATLVITATIDSAGQWIYSEDWTDTLTVITTANDGSSFTESVWQSYEFFATSSDGDGWAYTFTSEGTASASGTYTRRWDDGTEGGHGAVTYQWEGDWSRQRASDTALGTASGQVSASWSHVASGVSPYGESFQGRSQQSMVASDAAYYQSGPLGVTLASGAAQRTYSGVVGTPGDLGEFEYGYSDQFSVDANGAYQQTARDGHLDGFWEHQSSSTEVTPYAGGSIAGTSVSRGASRDAFGFAFVWSTASGVVQRSGGGAGDASGWNQAAYFAQGSYTIEDGDPQLPASGDASMRRQLQCSDSESGYDYSAYRYATDYELGPDGRWVAARGTGGSQGYGRSQTTHAGQGAYSYSLVGESSGTISGTLAESSHNETSYRYNTTARLAGAAWLESGLKFTEEAGGSRHEYTGSGSASGTSSGGFGEASLGIDESGLNTDQYAFRTTYRVAADGTWYAAAGDGHEEGNNASHWQSDGNGTRTVVRDQLAFDETYEVHEIFDDSEEYEIDSTYANGVWQSSGTKTLTESGQGNSSYLGTAGSYTYRSADDGTTDSFGSEESFYDYTIEFSLDPEGNWTVDEGEGWANGSGEDHTTWSADGDTSETTDAGHVHTTSYSEVRNRDSTYSYTTSSTLAAGSSAWQTTGGLTTTRNTASTVSDTVGCEWEAEDEYNSSGGHSSSTTTDGSSTVETWNHVVASAGTPEDADIAWRLTQWIYVTGTEHNCTYSADESHHFGEEREDGAESQDRYAFLTETTGWRSTATDTTTYDEAGNSTLNPTTSYLQWGEGERTASHGQSSNTITGAGNNGFSDSYSGNDHYIASQEDGAAWSNHVFGGFSSAGETWSVEFPSSTWNDSDAYDVEDTSCSWGGNAGVAFGAWEGCGGFGVLAQASAGAEQISSAVQANQSGAGGRQAGGGAIFDNGILDAVYAESGQWLDSFSGEALTISLAIPASSIVHQGLANGGYDNGLCVSPSGSPEAELRQFTDRRGKKGPRGWVLGATDTTVEIRFEGEAANKRHRYNVTNFSKEDQEYFKTFVIPPPIIPPLPLPSGARPISTVPRLFLNPFGDFDQDRVKAPSHNQYVSSLGTGTFTIRAYDLDAYAFPHGLDVPLPAHGIRLYTEYRLTKDVGVKDFELVFAGRFYKPGTTDLYTELYNGSPGTPDSTTGYLYWNSTGKPLAFPGGGKFAGRPGRSGIVEAKDIRENAWTFGPGVPYVGFDLEYIIGVRSLDGGKPIIDAMKVRFQVREGVTIVSVSHLDPKILIQDLNSALAAFNKVK